MTDTQLDALDKLIAAVEAGEFDGHPAKYNAFARAWEAGSTGVAHDNDRECSFAC